MVLHSYIIAPLKYHELNRTVILGQTIFDLALLYFTEYQFRGLWTALVFVTMFYVIKIIIFTFLLQYDYLESFAWM